MIFSLEVTKNTFTRNYAKGVGPPRTKNSDFEYMKKPPIPKPPLLSEG